MPSEQLLTKQVIGEPMDPVGVTIPVRFNLQRGKIARIWGFTFGVFSPAAGTVEYTCFVRKSANAEREQTPQDILWGPVLDILANGINFMGTLTELSIMFPKPYRTSGITVQMHGSGAPASRGLLVIYYDIDDVLKGELVQRWEKNISKGRTRRTISP